MCVADCRRTGYREPEHLVQEGAGDEGINALDAVGDVVELVRAIVDVLKVGVHVGPGVEGGTLGGNVGGGGGRNAAVGHVRTVESAVGTLVGNLLENTEHPVHTTSTVSHNQSAKKTTTLSHMTPATTMQ